MSDLPSTPRGTVVVTGGPSYEPIDQVRRLTNHATGELAWRLATQLTSENWEVVLLLGEGATFHVEHQPGSPFPEVLRFGTNDDLLALFRSIAGTRTVAAIFQTAALCDFRISGARAESGDVTGLSKIPSRDGTLTLTLEPATKVLAQLRELFPQTMLVGWKYELDGTKQDVIARGLRQLAECQTDLCILNGRAAGPGFDILAPNGSIKHVGGKRELAKELSAWLGERAQLLKP